MENVHEQEISDRKQEIGKNNFDDSGIMLSQIDVNESIDVIVEDKL